MSVFEKLTKGAIIDEHQGYAFYYYNNGEIIEKVNGKTIVNTGDDINFDTNFRLASVSKQFIAFGIVSLINMKKLNYNTTITKVFNDLPKYFDKITIKHLLNHTSGIFDYEDMPHKENDHQILDNDIIDFLKTTNTTYFEPGSMYKYSNTAYILLGLIIEKVSGISISEYMDKEVFKQAKMNESIVNLEGITNIKNRAYGHLKDEYGKLFMKDQHWCSATIGDGGLYSSINDLKKWCKYLSDSTNFVDMKVPNYVGENSYNEYGLGIRIIKHNDKEIYYHCGDTIGTNTLLLFSKELNICLIFLTNLGRIDTSIIKDNLLKLI